MLAKQNRLKKRKEFSYIYKNGTFSACKILSIIYCKGYKKTSKIGFSVSSKIGDAVTRNKVKRKMREAMRSIVSRINNNYNYINLHNSHIPILQTFCLLHSSILPHFLGMLLYLLHNLLRKSF